MWSAVWIFVNPNDGTGFYFGTKLTEELGYHRDYLGLATTYY
jgi:hypothetical protein